MPSVEVIDFRELGIDSGGLLAQTLESLELPCHLKRFRQFRTAISRLAKDAVCRQVLSAPSQALSMKHLVFLFDSHEKFLRAEGSWKNLGLLASHFRAYFRRVPQRLSCGSFVSDVEFRSRLPQLPAAEKVTLISEACDPASPEGFHGPISSLPHVDLQDLETKAARHLEVRLGRIESACWSSIDEFLTLASLVRERKASECPSVEDIFGEKKPLSKCTAAAVLYRTKLLANAGKTSEEIANYVWHWVRVTGLHARSDLWNKSVLALSQGTGVATWADSEGERDGRHSLFFSDYFLSHSALLCSQYLLQIHVGWNPDTVRALTAKSIQVAPDGSYIVRPFKPKSGQYLPPKHVGRHERVHRIIELLLSHRANVDEFVPSDNPSLFVGYQRNHRLFGLFNPKRAHRRLLQTYQLPPFAASQLRDQKANSLYLNSNRDVTLLKEYLGHANLMTVDTYLNHTIQRVLSMANLAEFIGRLDEAVRWVVGSDSRPKSPNSAQLLFPIDDLSHDGQCDAWLGSEAELTIGAEQIAHCTWQRAFYIDNFDRLRSENPRRFAVVHLPRIIFCSALYHVILQSPYRYLIDKFENKARPAQGVQP